MYLRALDGARRVEQMVRVRDYDAREDRWVRRCGQSRRRPATLTTPSSTRSSLTKRSRRRKW